MDLIQKIREAKFVAYNENRLPEAVYLGEVEFRELQRLAKKLGVKFNLRGMAPRVEGMDVFKVEAKSHLKVLSRRS